MPKIKPIHYRKLAKIFEAEGFQFDHQKGDHLIYAKQGTIRPIVIPMYGEVPVFIIKNNLETAGISRERFFILLEDV